MGWYDESRRLLDSPEKLVALVRQATGGDEIWLRNEASIEIRNGFLWVCNSPEVVAKVEEAVRGLATMK